MVLPYALNFRSVQQRLNLDVFLYLYLIFWDAVSLWTWSSLVWLDWLNWLASKLSAYPYAPALGYRHVPPHLALYIGAGVPKSGPHAHVARTFFAHWAITRAFLRNNINQQYKIKINMFLKTQVLKRSDSRQMLALQNRLILSSQRIYKVTNDTTCIVSQWYIMP